MHVRDVRIYHYDLPLQQPFRIAIGTMAAADDVLLRVETDSGLVGWGEACPFFPITGETQEANIAAARSLRELLVGCDPFAIDAFLRRAGPCLHTNPSILAAYDMALHDIQGRATGLPLYRLLGGEKRALETDITVDLDSPESMAARVRGFREAGYRIIKVKVGQDPDLDLARLAAVRGAAGDGCAIRIDANQGWTVPQAVSALRRMEPFRVEFVEQPVAASDLAGLREVRRRSPIPVMADESLYTPAQAVALVRAQACDYFNIKLMKSGGIRNALRIAHVAEAAGIRCMIGCMLESRLALTAAAHLMAARPDIVFADLDGHTSHTVDPVRGGMRLAAGAITLDETPGLGVEIDPAFLAALRQA